MQIDLEEQLNIANQNIEQLHEALNTEVLARQDAEGKAAYLETVVNDLLDDKVRLEVFEQLRDHVLVAMPEAGWVIYRQGFPADAATTFQGDTVREALDDMLSANADLIEQLLEQLNAEEVQEQCPEEGEQ